jgi:signal transduction histidine kinase
MSDAIRILLVEDNPAEARLIQERLLEVPHVRFDVEWCTTLQEGLAASGAADVILLDLSLPDSQGYQTFSWMHGAAPQAPLIVLTGFDDDILALKAVRQGAQDYLIKGEVSGPLLARAIHYAIERKEAERILQRRNEELAVLNTIAATVNQTLDIDQILNSALNAILNLDFFAGEAQGVIFLQKDDSAALQTAARYGEPLHLACGGEAHQAEQCLCGYAIERGEVVNGIGAEEAEVPCVCLPLQARGRTLGVMGLGQPVEQPISEEDVQLLRSIAAQITVAVENAQLFEKTKRWAVELATLHRTAQVIASVLDLEEVIQMIINEVRSMLHAEAASILLHETGTQELVFAAVAGKAAAKLKGLRMPASQGIAGWALREWQPVLVEDVQQDSRFYSDVDEITDLKTETLLAVPLRCKGKVIGVIEAMNRTERPFNEHDLNLLMILAGSAAVAVENARLFEAEKEQRKLVERSRAQLVQSEKLAATGRLAASLAHEINNPLQAIHNSLQMMLAFSISPEEQQEYIRMADEEVERLINMVARILDFARRPHREMRLIDVNSVVEKVLGLANKYLEHRRVTVTQALAPELPAILANPNELGQVFLNLVINGVEALEENGKLQIESGLFSDNYVQVTIADNGKGIAPEHLDYVFEPFFSTKDEGTGLGLSISFNLVKRHGGEITVHSALGEGTTFAVLLPIYREEEHEGEEEQAALEGELSSSSAAERN